MVLHNVPCDCPACACCPIGSKCTFLCPCSFIYRYSEYEPLADTMVSRHIICGATILDENSKLDLLQRACNEIVNSFSMPCDVFDAQHAKPVGRHKLLLKIIWFPKEFIFPCHTSTATSIGREDCVISKLSAAPIPHNS